MMIRERERKREREKSKHRNALLAYHGSGPGHPVPSASRDRLHFLQECSSSSRPFAYICKRSVTCVKGAEKSEFCARFQSGVFLKTQRDKKGGTLHSFEYSTTTTLVK